MCTHLLSTVSSSEVMISTKFNDAISSKASTPDIVVMLEELHQLCPTLSDQGIHFVCKVLLSIRMYVGMYHI